MVSGQFLGVLFKEGGFLKTENMKHVEVILSTVLEAGPRGRKSCKFSLEDPRAVVFFFFTSLTLSPPQHTHTRTHARTHTPESTETLQKPHILGTWKVGIKILFNTGIS